MKLRSVFQLLGVLGLVLVSCSRVSDVENVSGLPGSFGVPVDNIDLTDDVWDGHAICYGGFRAGQAPGGAYPSDAEILEDLKILEKNWNLLRFYNSDAHGEAVLRVIAENQLSLKVLLGVYIFKTKGLAGAALANNEALNQQNIREGVRLAETYPDLVVGINIGNEALVSWSFVPNEVATMVGYVRQVAGALAAADLAIPLTVADNYAFWESADGVVLAAELDFITVHGYAMWDGHGIAEGLTFLDEHVAAVKANIPDKPVVVGETGWATYAEDAQIYGQIGAEANEANQAIYFDQLSSWSQKNNITTFLFEAFDEPWKGGGNVGAAEGHWGVFAASRKAKLVMHRYYPELVTDDPTSPDYSDFEFEPVPNVAHAFRATTVSEYSIDTFANALNSCTLALNTTAYEGAQSLQFLHDGLAWGGFYSNFSPALDLSTQQNIVFALSGLSEAVAYFELKLESGSNGTSLNILAYPPTTNGDWSIYTIPLADFADVEASQLSAIGFWHPFDNAIYNQQQGHYVVSNILIDDIQFR